MMTALAQVIGYTGGGNQITGGIGMAKGLERCVEANIHITIMGGRKVPLSA